MHLVVAALVLLAVLFGPQLWARGVLARYGTPRDDFPGTGGELARHLVERFGLSGVRVERTEGADHYDPAAKAVRLSPPHYDGRSLSAVAVAAHEVGHAIQDRQGYAPLRLRTALVQVADKAQGLGAWAVLAVPVVGGLTRSPLAAGLLFVAALGGLGLGVLAHLVTLPVEWDASFRKALPVLATGYVPRSDLPAVRRILRACALTYLAGALAGLLHFGRWIALARRGLR